MNKKLIALALPVLAMTLVLSGCGKKAVDQPAPAEPAVEAPAEVQNTEEANTAEVKGDSVAVNLETSKVTWEGRKKIGSSHNGDLMLKSGNVLMADGMLVGGTFVLDMTTINDLDQEGKAKESLEAHLKSADFFDVENHPEGKVEIKSVEKLESGKLLVTADLTLKGNTNEVSFETELLEKDGVYTASANLEIDRVKWDIVFGSGSVFDDLGDAIIEDMLKIGVEVSTVVPSEELMADDMKDGEEKMMDSAKEGEKMSDDMKNGEEKMMDDK